MSRVRWTESLIEPVDAREYLLRDQQRFVRFHGTLIAKTQVARGAAVFVQVLSEVLNQTAMTALGAMAEIRHALQRCERDPVHCFGLVAGK